MALSTSITVVTRSGLSTHDHYDVRNLFSVGVATFSNFKTGSTNVHNVGVEVAGINVLGGDTPIGSGSTIYDDGGARFSGIISATKFVGDISDATGAAAGLGTALSQTQTSPLNKTYFTNKVLSIGATVTVDPPPSSTFANTNYSDIKISGADLIIKDGDEFIPDVLGISTTKLFDIVGNVTGDVTGNLTGNVTGATIFSPFGNTLTFGTNNTERLRISSDGIVTKPNQPAFSVYINGFTSESTNTNTQIMPFNTTHTNIGGHFKTDQYKFIAPVAGNYFFSLSQNHNSRVDSKILKNGVKFHEGENEIPVSETGGEWHHHTLTCVMPLAAGDKVHCTTRNQDGSPYRAWNSGDWDNFSGFLIG